MNEQHTILVVEDDKGLRTALERSLRFAGYNVVVAADGSVGLEALTNDHFDAVVLDVGLPHVDGMSLCRLLRQRGRTEPVIMLTARATVPDRVEGLDAGADDYLTKPFDYPELTARIRALLRRPTESQAPILTHGQLEMDPASRRVSRSSITIPLTAREFALLEVLLRAPLTTHPRTDLLERVWDANYDGLSNVVDVHIANLRRKLELPGLPDPIETVRGVGYRLTPIGNE